MFFLFFGSVRLAKIVYKGQGHNFFAHVEQLPRFPKKLVASNEKNEFRTCPFFLQKNE